MTLELSSTSPYPVRLKICHQGSELLRLYRQYKARWVFFYDLEFFLGTSTQHCSQVGSFSCG